MNEELRLEAMDASRQGATLLNVGNIETAKKKLDQAIKLDPMLMDSYKNYGDLYMKLKNYPEAKNYYRKALLIEKNGQVYFLYGNACFMNDEPHEGLQNYNLALAAGFDNDEMLFFMGMAYEYLNDDRMALRYVQKALAKNPSRPDYKVKKISILLRLDMLDEADEAIDQLLLDDPELYDAYHMKISMLLERGKNEEAVKFARSATERFPEDADLFHDYARTLALKGDLEEALAVVNRAKKLKYYEDAKTKFLNLEAQILAEQNHIDEAIACCKECIALEGDSFNSEIRFMLSNLYLTKPDYEQTLALAEELIEKNQKDTYYFSALYYRPFCLSHLDRKDEANRYYEEAVKIYRVETLKRPEALDVYLLRVMCLKDLERYDDALDLLDFIEGITTEVAEIYSLRADIYKLTGKTALFKQEMEKAIARKPELKNLYQKDEVKQDGDSV